MKKKMGFVGLAVMLIALGAALGYWYGNSKGKQEADLVRYDSALFRLSLDAYVIDALDIGKIDEAKLVLLGGVEGNISIVMQKYQDHPEISLKARCFVTRKARQWYTEKKILADRQRLTRLEYPTDEVIEYVNTQCPGALPKPNIAR